MATEAGLRKRHSKINVVGVHFEMRWRARQVQKRLPHVVVSSGARPKWMQTELYNKWIAFKTGRSKTRANLAANPNRKWPDGRMGSAHQIQEPDGYKVGAFPNEVGWAYAFDFGFEPRSKGTAAAKRELEQVCGEEGLVRNVPSEWWHFVPEEAAGARRQVRKLEALTGRGDRSDRALQVQKMLAKIEIGNKPFYEGALDGDYGPKTTSAVARFQKSQKRPVNGDWCVDDNQVAAELLRKLSASKTVDRPGGGVKSDGRVGGRRRQLMAQEIGTARAALDKLERLASPNPPKST